MRVALHPDAEQDLLGAAAFYEREGSRALAARFVAEFKRVGALLAEQPDVGAPRSRGRRVKHDRRRPGYGGARS